MDVVELQSQRTMFSWSDYVDRGAGVAKLFCYAQENRHSGLRFASGEHDGDWHVASWMVMRSLSWTRMLALLLVSGPTQKRELSCLR